MQSTEAIPERPAITVAPAALNAYTGHHARDGVVTVIAREGDALSVKSPNFPKRKLTPTADAQFFDKVGGEWTFHRGSDGRVAHFVLRSRGRELRGTRVE
jgi:hypothetical protein